MNPRNNLILINKNSNYEVKTKDVKYIKKEKNRALVTFTNNKTYAYHKDNVKWYSNPQEIDITDTVLYHSGERIQMPIKLLRFAPWYVLVYKNEYMKTYGVSDLQIIRNHSLNSKSVDLWQYFRELSAEVSLVLEDGKALLKAKYNRIHGIDPSTVLSKYLTGNAVNKIETKNTETIIYPFGCNVSQKEAVVKALYNQISVIEGPPGTGKTQTILNIIANLIIQGKTIAVVSNNNSATQNVLDKLQKNELDFFAAFLGNAKNKESFIESGQTDIPNSIKNMETIPNLNQALLDSLKNINVLLKDTNTLARLKQELDETKLEAKYFEEYLSINKEYSEEDLKGVSSQKLLTLRCDIENHFKTDQYTLSFFTKLKYIFNYGLRLRKFVNINLKDSLDIINHQFYISKIDEIHAEIKSLEERLMYFNYDEAMRRLVELSQSLLKEYLATRYGHKTRPEFCEKDLWQRSNDFLKEYPLILSTTFSINSSLSENTIYDYVIIDEASQVDLITGNLALSCAKNAVIVGDRKQLSNVVSREQKEQSKQILSKYSIPERYHYHKYSLLESVLMTFPNIEKTLLREHYRCHPKIIQFCNKKFYQDQLIIMTHDQGEEDVIKIIKTLPGNHSRGRYNQRQIDEIIQKVLPELENHQAHELGIISPYREQKYHIDTVVSRQGYEVDTVHKYQGKEKNDIIITTVDNVISEFIDDPNMLNVAISRAKKRIRLIVSDHEKNEGTNISDFIHYVSYNNFEVQKGSVFSVFDMLYRHYNKQRQEYIKKSKLHLEYDSEKIIDVLIKSVIDENEAFEKYAYCSHLSLRQIVRKREALTARELEFVNHPNAHVDFMIFRRIDKHPVLVIEVDGYDYHKKGTAQYERDRIKDSIMKKIDLKILRLATNASGEKQKIIETLERIN